MFQSGGQSEVRPPVFKSESKLGTHLSTHCSRDERPSQHCPAGELNLGPDILVVQGVGKLTEIVTDAKPDVMFYCSSDILFDILYEAHVFIGHGCRDSVTKELKDKKLLKKNRALHFGIKRTLYEAMFGCPPRIGLSTTPIPREVFDPVEDKQQFENPLTAVTACSLRKDEAIFAKETSSNEIAF
ncbi:hypothetical protein TNCV_1625151 [Trichonephila clavipes]|nr:hypothetical protein TNCV_1625151 [Trichonephila clavipes]